MEISNLTADEYGKIVLDRRVFFNDPTFCELNKDKVDKVHYLIISKGDSARFGIILGQAGTEMRCPFSAPYSYPVEIKNHSKVEDVDEALNALEEYCKAQGAESLRFIFPPLFYDEHLLSAWVNAFYRMGYKVDNVDLSYALDLKNLCEQEDYAQHLPEKGRKALRKAIRSDLYIQHCKTLPELEEAYHIIKANHDAKDRPTRLTFEQLIDTLKLVEYDAFIVKHGDESVAAEFLYCINSKIVQGIYCGVLPDATKYNAMNFLTDYTIHYYYEKGYEILDKATATEDSVPNYGLCNFKESVGCRRSLKYTFSKQL